MTAAFASTISGRISCGNKFLVYGTYTASGGSTGGDITTGLGTILAIHLQAGGSSVVADAPTLNETLPLKADGATAIVTADTTGYWWAIGTD